MITYSHEYLIAEAIQGVLIQQCDFDVELIIADDCSPDNTCNVIDSFKTHPNFDWIKYTKHELNKGANNNFIWAVGQAKGKYIAICEGDDYWTDPLKLQMQVDILESNENYGLIYSDCQIKLENKLIESQIIGRAFLNLNDYFNAGLPFIYTLSWLFRNEISDLNFFSGKFGYLPGDVQIVCHFLDKAYSLQFSDRIIGVYRILEESAAHSKLHDKDKDFVLVKWLLLNKYNLKLSKDTHHVVLNDLIQKKFQYFKYFKLGLFRRFVLFNKIARIKGLSRAGRFLIYNVS
jgi:glycosyltransferase involved in cell wall biosynthesis